MGAGLTALATKFQLRKGESIRVLEAPRGLELDLPRTRSRKARGVLLFARDSQVLRSKGAPVLDAARSDRLAWIAYPKGGQLDTDLDRDRLWRLLEKEQVRPVRQIAVDDIWSAVRFRPA